MKGPFLFTKGKLGSGQRRQHDLCADSNGFSLHAAGQVVLKLKTQFQRRLNCSQVMS